MRRWLVFFLLSALLPLCFAAAVEPTSSGVWDGSWLYRNRDQAIALFMRTVDGEVQIRISFDATTHNERWDTDWNGAAAYKMSGKDASFALHIDEAGADRLVGRWDWDRSGTWLGRTEASPVEIVRLNDGRQLQIRFQDMKIGKHEDGSLVRSRQTSYVYGFTKVSKRIVRWEELPL